MFLIWNMQERRFSNNFKVFLKLLDHKLVLNKKASINTCRINNRSSKREKRKNINEHFGLIF